MAMGPSCCTYTYTSTCTYMSHGHGPLLCIHMPPHGHAPPPCVWGEPPTQYISICIYMPPHGHAPHSLRVGGATHTQTLPPSNVAPLHPLLPRDGCHHRLLPPPPSDEAALPGGRGLLRAVVCAGGGERREVVRGEKSVQEPRQGTGRERHGSARRGKARTEKGAQLPALEHCCGPMLAEAGAAPNRPE